MALEVSLRRDVDFKIIVNLRGLVCQLEPVWYLVPRKRPFALLFASANALGPMFNGLSMAAECAKLIGGLRQIEHGPLLANHFCPANVFYTS